MSPIFDQLLIKYIQLIPIETFYDDNYSTPPLQPHTHCIRSIFFQICTKTSTDHEILLKVYLQPTKCHWKCEKDLVLSISDTNSA